MNVVRRRCHRRLSHGPVSAHSRLSVLRLLQLIFLRDAAGLAALMLHAGLLVHLFHRALLGIGQRKTLAVRCRVR